MSSVLIHEVNAHSPDDTDENARSVILEVEGDPADHLDALSAYHPFVDVVKTFDTLLNAIAVKGSPEKIDQIGDRDFVKVVHPVTTYSVPDPVRSSQSPITYEALQPFRRSPVASPSTEPNTNPQTIPGDLNTTPYTGQGVKVGVIDTGIDPDHPDLEANYKGGYDLVDLDDEPMETNKSEGLPTQHGTHVAGIIAANGQLKGVAPEADIYAYRALGSGGRGTSVQVIAALEQAVEDEMDMINLSLGNAVNGPDFPTSQAVNKAYEAGTMVVTANGNDGPEDWTVGSPAAASKALSVGATEPASDSPYLYHAATDRQMNIEPLMESVPWTLEKDYPLKQMNDQTRDMTGQIALAKRGETPFHELAKQAEETGAKAVLIMNSEEGVFAGSIGSEDAISIPVAAISQNNGRRLNNLANARDHIYLDTKYSHTKQSIASFSSRGPVTASWAIKPQISAPGVNVISTVPDGYQALQGTSMAAPHVTGALAVLKEAKPDWSNDQLKSALTTTARPMEQEKKPIRPSIQGTGEINLKDAIGSKTLIKDPFLSYGQINQYKQTQSIDLTIDNVADQQQTYRFSVPKKSPGRTWNLPQSFTIDPKTTKTVSVGLSMTSPQLDKGVHQGWLQLQRSGDSTYELPYLFVNQTADYPNVMGVGITPKPLSDKDYTYQFYLPDKDVKQVTIDLYHPQSLIHVQTLLTTTDVSAGLNEGDIAHEEIDNPGRYMGVLSMTRLDGTIETSEFSVTIPP